MMPNDLMTLLKFNRKEPKKEISRKKYHPDYECHNNTTYRFTKGAMTIFSAESIPRSSASSLSGALSFFHDTVLTFWGKKIWKQFKFLIQDLILLAKQIDLFSWDSEGEKKKPVRKHGWNFFFYFFSYEPFTTNFQPEDFGSKNMLVPPEDPCSASSLGSFSFFLPMHWKTPENTGVDTSRVIPVRREKKISHRHHHGVDERPNMEEDDHKNDNPVIEQRQSSDDGMKKEGNRGKQRKNEWQKEEETDWQWVPPHWFRWFYQTFQPMFRRYVPIKTRLVFLIGLVQLEILFREEKVAFLLQAFSAKNNFFPKERKKGERTIPPTMGRDLNKNKDERKKTPGQEKKKKWHFFLPTYFHYEQPFPLATIPAICLGKKAGVSSRRSTHHWFPRRLLEKTEWEEWSSEQAISSSPLLGWRLYQFWWHRTQEPFFRPEAEGAAMRLFFWLRKAFINQSTETRSAFLGCEGTFHRLWQILLQEARSLFQYDYQEEQKQQMLILKKQKRPLGIEVIPCESGKEKRKQTDEEEEVSTIETFLRDRKKKKKTKHQTESLLIFPTNTLVVAHPKPSPFDLLLPTKKKIRRKVSATDTQRTASSAAVCSRWISGKFLSFFSFSEFHFTEIEKWRKKAKYQLQGWEKPNKSPNGESVTHLERGNQKNLPRTSSNSLSCSDGSFFLSVRTLSMDLPKKAPLLVGSRYVEKNPPKKKNEKKKKNSPPNRKKKKADVSLVFLFSSRRRLEKIQKTRVSLTTSDGMDVVWPEKKTDTLSSRDWNRSFLEYPSHSCPIFLFGLEMAGLFFFPSQHLHTALAQHDWFLQQLFYREKPPFDGYSWVFPREESFILSGMGGGEGGEKKKENSFDSFSSTAEEAVEDHCTGSTKSPAKKKEEKDYEAKRKKEKNALFQVEPQPSQKRFPWGPDMGGSFFRKPPTFPRVLWRKKDQTKLVRKVALSVLLPCDLFHSLLSSLSLSPPPVPSLGGRKT
jgi:hypothetical protein